MLKALGKYQIVRETYVLRCTYYECTNCGTKDRCPTTKFAKRKCVRCSADARYRVPALAYLTVKEAAKKLQVSCNEVHEMLYQGLTPQELEKCANKHNNWLILGPSEDPEKCRARCLNCQGEYVVNKWNVIFGLSKQCLHCSRKAGSSTQSRLSSTYPKAYASFERVRKTFGLEPCWRTFKMFVKTCPAILLHNEFNVVDRTKPFGPNNFRIGKELKNCLDAFLNLPWKYVTEKLGISKQAVHQLQNRYVTHADLIAARPDIKEKLWGRDN